MDDAPANIHRTSSGRLRPVCEFCGRKGRSVAPEHVSARGHLDIFELGGGWSVAPYPPEHVYTDGSTGDLFTCLDCNTRLTRGEALPARQGVVRRLT